MDEARHVDATADDIVAGLGRAGDRLARECGGVELGFALDDDAVDRHALAGLDHDHGADGDVIGKDLFECAVGLLDVSVVGRDVHHGTDRLAALAHGVCLEQLADLVEQHDSGAFGHVRVGVGEEHHGKCADGRDCHKETLVEGLAAADVIECLLQYVVSGNQKRHEEQREAGVDVARLPKCDSEGAELVEGINNGKNAQCYQDAVALVLKGLFLLALLLFLFGIGGCHDSNLPFECMNTCSYNFASKGRGKRGLTGQRMRGLENDFAVRLGVGGELNDAVQDLVELGVVSLERQLLGHKVDRNGLDAIELSQLVLKFTRAVGAIDLVELELLFHGGFLSLC